MTKLKKVSQIHRKSDGVIRPRKVVKQDITKEQFLTVLDKVCQPIRKDSIESDSEKSET